MSLKLPSTQKGRDFLRRDICDHAFLPVGNKVIGSGRPRQLRWNPANKTRATPHSKWAGVELNEERERARERISLRKYLTHSPPSSRDTDVLRACLFCFGLVQKSDWDLFCKLDNIIRVGFLNYELIFDCAARVDCVNTVLVEQLQFKSGIE